MRNSLRLCALFLLVVPSLFAAPGAVRCGRLLDVRSGKLSTDQAVVFDDAGIITSVTAFASAKLPQGIDQSICPAPLAFLV